MMPRSSGGKEMPKVTQQAEPPSLDLWVKCFFHHTNCSHTPTNISHTPPLDCQNTTFSQEPGLKELGKATLPSSPFPAIPIASKLGPATPTQLQQQQ